ncbi:hypothetical protein FRB95_013687 [Tulasnella sp. JGI-2019a]|nr:hypothetical protein FRB93_000688 [Tulasnella sp. JGI-2019a]KAG9034168.1 hypothetical protein FRB95_013687 [Tulasnella sp. JGI-2019a]
MHHGGPDEERLPGEFTMSILLQSLADISTERWHRFASIARLIRHLQMIDAFTCLHGTVPSQLRTMVHHYHGPTYELFPRLRSVKLQLRFQVLPSSFLLNNREIMPQSLRVFDVTAPARIKNLKELELSAAGDNTSHLNTLCRVLPTATPRLMTLKVTLDQRNTISYAEVEPLTQLKSLETMVIQHYNNSPGFVDFKWTDSEVQAFTTAMPQLVELRVQTWSYGEDDEDDEDDILQPGSPTLSPKALLSFTRNCPKLQRLAIRIDFGPMVATGQGPPISDGDALFTGITLDLTDSRFFLDDDPDFPDDWGFDSQSEEFGGKVMMVAAFLVNMCARTTRLHLGAERNRMRDYAAWNQVQGAYTMQVSGDVTIITNSRWLMEYMWCLRNGPQRSKGEWRISQTNLLSIVLG